MAQALPAFAEGRDPAAAISGYPPAGLRKGRSRMR